jgi:hypothetical protein
VPSARTRSSSLFLKPHSDMWYETFDMS